MVNSKITAVGLFAGAGGLDLGFRMAGIRTVAAFDVSRAAVDTYNRNSKGRIASVLDLAKSKPSTLVEHVKHTICDAVLPKILLGGPPCQGFSRGNASADPKDVRNLLPYRYIDALAAFDDWAGIDAFVFENVPCLRSPRHISRFKRICNRFANIGFNVFDANINSLRFGVPQTRLRLFIVGFNRRLEVGDFKIPTGKDRFDATPTTVRDAIGDLPEPVFRRNGMIPADIPFHPNHWTSQPVSSKFADQRFDTGRSFRRLRWDQPSKTVAYGNREIHIHPNGTRRLSIFEAMLLQGFPKSFVFCGTFSEQVTQVSNAVPPPVAQAIARAVSAHLSKS